MVLHNSCAAHFVTLKKIAVFTICPMTLVLIKQKLQTLTSSVFIKHVKAFLAFYMPNAPGLQTLAE